MVMTVMRIARFGALALVSAVAATPVRGAAQTGSVSARGAAAVVTTALGTQLFAASTLPDLGGMADSELSSIAVQNLLTAGGLTSITTGQSDGTLVSATTTAEAADVNLLGGLITARTAVAVTTSYVNGGGAASEATGSTLLGLVINGLSYGDVSPAANTRVDLPGVGYVILNEQIPTGDGVRSTGLTVNLIHAYLIDPSLGTVTGDIVVGMARSAASF
jgi:hypothetical protein